MEEKRITISGKDFDDAVHKALPKVMEEGKEKVDNPIMVLAMSVSAMIAYRKLRDTLFGEDAETNSQEEALREAVNGPRD